MMGVRLKRRQVVAGREREREGLLKRRARRNGDRLHVSAALDREHAAGRGKLRVECNRQRMLGLLDKVDNVEPELGRGVAAAVELVFEQSRFRGRERGHPEGHFARRRVEVVDGSRGVD